MPYLSYDGSFRHPAPTNIRLCYDGSFRHPTPLDAGHTYPQLILRPVLDQFTNLGYSGPAKVLTTDQCQQLLTEYRRNVYPLIPDWPKGMATVSATIYRIATQPAILDTVKTLLGNDVMLWGATFITRMENQIHPWHNDIESSVQEGRTVSVWIGIENTTQESSLQLISYSHRFKESIQEVRHKLERERSDATSQEILTWARERDPYCALFVPEMTNGDALFFDGWLWHASHNTSNKKRTALLLQYATPDTPIRIPDPNNFEWPFKLLQHPKPPCIMVSGSDYFGVNRIVPAPASHDGQEKFELSARMYTLDIPLLPDPDKKWKAFPIFRGSTPNLQGITCHVSALNPGHTPHPPHQHKEEEILILLNGEADVTLPDLSAKGLPTTVSLKPGDFVYYPALFFHTITAKGEVPANYLMFKWFNSKDRYDDAQHRKVNTLEYGKYSMADIMKRKSSDKSFSTSHVFQEPTDCLQALQCHTSVVLPGGGYPIHTDAHDVAIVTWKGHIETLGERAGPYSVLFFPAGQPHDMHNPSEDPAEYLVFEFHGNHPPPVKRKRRSVWVKMRDPQAWKNKFKEIKNRL